MKIRTVCADARKRQFVITTAKASYVLPYAMLPLSPTASDPIATVAPDEEIGGEGFTYRLRSGRENTVHLDAVLDYNRDPEYVREQILYRLSVRAADLVRDKHLSKRALSRRLKTSPAQIYRLLDPTCYHKTIDQMIRLLHVLGAKVHVVLGQAA